jgi:plastocyanin
MYLPGLFKCCLLHTCNGPIFILHWAINQKKIRIMKSRFLLLAFTLLTFMNATATVHMVDVADFMFTPSTLTVRPGDTIRWMWVNGTHTTTSNSIPSGATPWNHNINSASSFFDYVPTVPGTYNYICSIHPTLMVASFTVSNPAATPITAGSLTGNAWPNPASNTLHIVFNNATQPVTVSLVNMAGREVMRKEYTALKETDLNIAAIPEGNYILRTEQNSNVAIRKLVIHH